MDPKQATEQSELSKSPEDTAKDTSTSQPTEETQLQTDLQALLDEMQTSFQSFSDGIFTKIDDMQEKIDELESSVTNLSVTTTAVAPIVQDAAAPENDDGPSESAPDNTPDLPPPLEP